MKRGFIVVTGAAGFIGSSLVRYLNDLGFEDLLLVDDLYVDDKWKNLVGKRFVDLISKKELFNFLGASHHVDAIFHLGACSSTLEGDGDYLLENNYRYSMRLASYALQHNKRFIYASSAATYGDGSLGFKDSDEALDSLRPLNKYGFSKHLFDLWLLRTGAIRRVTGLKYFNIFGPNEYHKKEMMSMICKMTNLIQKEGMVRLYKSTDPKYKDGDQLRDFLYVKDAVALTHLFLEKRAFGIYNIGRGEAVTWNSLAKAIFKALNREVKIEYIDMPQQMVKQYQNYTCADVRKLLSLGNYTQGTSKIGISAAPKPRGCAITPGPILGDIDPGVIDTTAGAFAQAEIPIFEVPWVYSFWSIEDSVKDYVQNYILKGAYY